MFCSLRLKVYEHCHTCLRKCPPFFLEHYYNDYFKATVECCRVVVVKLNRFLSAALKKAFVAKKPIQKMAKEDFIMVNLVVIKDLLYMEKLFSPLQCSAQQI